MPTSTTPDEVPLYATDGNYAAGAETWSSTPRRVATGIAAWAAAGATPEQPRLAQSENEYIARIAEVLAWLRGEVGTAVFGEGTADTTLGAGTTTLTADTYYHDLTVPNGSTLVTAGYRLFVSGTLTVAAGGAISADGAAASGLTAGAAGATGSVLAGAAGGNGRTNAGTATAGSTSTSALGGAGGAGGATTSFAGATGGSAQAPAPSLGGWLHLAAAQGRATGGAQTQWEGGGGGGGGSCENGNTGTSGGGGAGGGVLVIFAREVDNSGTISADGGIGADAVLGNSTEISGGGGGGGGVVFLVHREAVGGTLGTVTANGGAGGAGAGAGLSGATGSNGLVLLMVG